MVRNLRKTRMAHKAMRIRYILPLLLLMSILQNCWFYSFKGTLPPHIKNVAIPLFEDRTAEFNIQQVMTDLVRLGFIRENILKLVETEQAQSVLYGTIQDVQDRPLVFQESEAGESVTEYRITVRAEVEWFDLVENVSMFKKQFTGYSEYDPTGASERTRDLALEESINNITQDIINAILAGW